MYLANDLLNDVEKLIMIGTPNQGSPIANWAKMLPSDMAPLFGEFLCTPAIYDLIPCSDTVRSQIHNGTTYYTIAGNRTPSLYNTFNFSYPPVNGACLIFENANKQADTFWFLCLCIYINNMLDHLIVNQ